MDNLHDVMVDLVKDLYHAEKQLLKAMPKMAKAASSDSLRTAFKDHLEETRVHVERLEQVFGQLELKPTAKMCHGMKGLIEEGSEVIEEKTDSDPAAIDAALIAAAQKVEHYEITAYGTLATFADTLGLTKVSALFKKTLNEEEEADLKLSKLAKGSVNQLAADAGDADEEEPGSSAQRKRTSKGPSRSA